MYFFTTHTIVHIRTEGGTDGWIHERMDGWVDGWMDLWMYVSIDK